MIPLRTVNDRCLLLDGRDLVLVGEEGLGITGTCALGHRRGGGDLHLHHRVVDVDAEAEVNEEVVAAAAAMLIVLCPVLPRKIGIDTGFDLGTCCIATFCYIPRVLTGICVHETILLYAYDTNGICPKGEQGIRDLSLAVTGSRLITSPMTNEALLKNINQIIQTIDTKIRMLMILQPTVLHIQ